MKITEENLIEYVLKNGESLGISFADIEFVGVEKVLAGIDRQVVAKTAHLGGIDTVVYEGELPIAATRNCSYDEHSSAAAAMQDYFCDGSFDSAYDRAYMNW